VVESTITPEEIKELLGYLHSIKAYEEWFDLYISTLVIMIWGLIFIFAGLFDFIFANPSNNEYARWIIWFGVFILGTILENFSTRQVSLTPKSSSTPNSYLFHIGIGIGMILIFSIILTFRLDFLIFPIAGIIVAGMFSLNLLNFYKSSSCSLPELLFPAVMSIVSAIINIIGFLFNGNNFLLFHGLIFGIVVGISLTSVAYVIRRRIQFQFRADFTEPTII